MRKITAQLQRFHGPACVSILLKTHRTHPENQQDMILLKNLIKESQERLEKEFDKQVARERTEQFQTLIRSINVNYNLDGLLLVAGDGIAEMVPLPIDVESRVVIADNFATRDLVRAIHDQSAYYVLVLSQKKARLILAFSDRVVEEVGASFPIENEHLHPASRDEAAVGNRQDQFIEEFFNRVDKQVQQTIKSAPYPIVVAADRRNYDRFQQVADHKESILAHLNGSHETAKPHDIIKAAWSTVREKLALGNEARISELRQAVSQQVFLSDLSDIWKAVQQGRGKTLFVERGYFQPARIEDGKVIPHDSPQTSQVIDDIVDELVELTMQFGGDVVFLDQGTLDDFQKIALVTRY